jgi:hypothetical protein
MKCIDQIPVPMAKAPPATHQRAAAPAEWATRSARRSAVYDARTATSHETRTSDGS